MNGWVGDLLKVLRGLIAAGNFMGFRLAERMARSRVEGSTGGLLVVTAVHSGEDERMGWSWVESSTRACCCNFIGFGWLNGLLEACLKVPWGAACSTSPLWQF